MLCGSEKIPAIHGYTIVFGTSARYPAVWPAGSMFHISLLIFSIVALAAVTDLFGPAGTEINESRRLHDLFYNGVMMSVTHSFGVNRDVRLKTIYHMRAATVC